jgi:dTMP kinase
VLFGAGLVAAIVGVLAYRQMDDRRAESILTDLRTALTRRRRGTGGLLIAVEGNSRSDTADQAGRLADWLRERGREVLLAAVSPLDEQRLRTVLDSAGLTGERARALVAAALRAEVVERQIRPALATGTVVVMERYVDSPLAHLGAEAGVSSNELEGLVDWATGRLRPDITVLLDRNPDGMGSVTAPRGLSDLEHSWKVQKILTEIAAANPDRYVVVDADDTPDTVATRVKQALDELLPPPRPAGWPPMPGAVLHRAGAAQSDDGLTGGSGSSGPGGSGGSGSRAEAK